MAITRAKKGEIVEGLKKAIKGAKSLVFLNFRGLGVTDATLMRQALIKDGISYKVAKKTLVKLALGDHDFKGETPVLDGELALAWGDDLVAPARGVYGFQKKFPENLKMMGGIFDGRFMSAGEMEGIAQIPTMEVLRGKFVNIINSPIQRLAIALNEVAKIK